jgi:hypothetical protein
VICVPLVHVDIGAGSFFGSLPARLFVGGHSVLHLGRGDAGSGAVLQGEVDGPLQGERLGNHRYGNNTKEPDQGQHAAGAHPNTITIAHWAL